MDVEEAAALERFGREYAVRRRQEGRALSVAELRSLPFLAGGPFAAEWAVRARSYKALLRLLEPAARHGPLDVLDLGAGNGWLSYRLAQRGHRCTAVDLRDDTVDGLGAAEELRRLAAFACVVAPFEALPLPDRSADVAIFNASLHYATDLAAVLSEARRCVRPGGLVVVLDSPFYRREAEGQAMVREKGYTHGIKFLTRERLGRAAALRWTRRRVWYPPWYELRFVRAWLRGRRAPSRFDLWWARV